MQITRAADYAVRATIHLATLPTDRKAPLGELAEATGVRDNFLSKILQRLVRKGLLTSYRGTGGGFRLGVPAESLTLLQVVEAIEGPIELNICVNNWQSCSRKFQCFVHPVWQKAQDALSEMLAGVTIAELARETVEKSKIVTAEGMQSADPPVTP